ncbi:hypothetical protein [Haloprofundus halobius]|uniref:hypothetical protein n=1 Tax=Haloprofundus halobius TaxID=2876194 RepID=UPI001CCAE1BF|nr:hypothetical protein [Haloprofundus halobius]
MPNQIKKLGGVITGGVVSGFWVAVGFNPVVKIGEVTITEAASITDYSASSGYLAPSEFMLLIHLFVAGMTMASLLGAWMLGGKTGVIALGCSFVAGVVVLNNFRLGTFLLCIAYGLFPVGVLLNNDGRSGRAPPRPMGHR